MPTYLSRASAKQVEANRRNALRSTGPVTESGRARSSQNSTKHWLCARIVPGVNPAQAGEDPADYARFAEAMRRDLRPCGEVEEVLADRAAQLAWRLRRVPAAEAEAADRMIAAKREAHVREEFGRKKTVFVGPGAGALLAETCLGKEAGVFERLQIYEQRLERQFHGCLQQLRLLRKMKGEQNEQREQGESSESDHRPAESAAHAGEASPDERPVARAARPCGGTEEAKTRAGRPCHEAERGEPASPVRGASLSLMDLSLSETPENAGERTKPMLAEGVAGPDVGEDEYTCEKTGENRGAGDLPDAASQCIMLGSPFRHGCSV